MATRPSTSPWGRVQTCHKKHTGVYEVTTPGHGGIMVDKDVANKLLTAEAISRSIDEKGYYSFEEDCDAAIVIREMLDLGVWEIPSHFKAGKTEYENIINSTLVRYHPKYWCARQRGENAI